MWIKKLAMTAAILFTSAQSSLAQCSMCRANIAHAENVAEVSHRVNTAILVLLIPTLLIIGGLIRLIFKYRNSQGIYVNIRSTDAQRRFK